jgi:PAS domain S-box-containing protein
VATVPQDMPLLAGVDPSVLRLLFDRAPAMIWVSDPDGQNVFCNQKWLTFRGRTAQQELGLGWQEGIHPDDRDALSEKWAETCRLRRSSRSEVRILRADGEYRWILDETEPLMTPDGRCAGFIGNAMDVTDLRRSEQRQREAVEGFRALTDAIPGAVYRHLILPDGKKRFLFVSDGIRELLGVEPAAVMADGESLYRLIAPESEPQWREAAARALDSGPPVVRDVEFIRPDGRRVHVRVNASLKRGADGSRLWTGVLTDVSHEKRTTADLARVRERAELALETAVDGLWDWNVQTGELYVAPQNLRMLGYGPGVAMSRIEQWRALYHPDETGMIRDCLQEHFAARSGIYEIVRRLRHADGSYRWVQSRGRVVQRGPAGEPIRMVGTNVDLTASRRAEEALRASEERFRAAFEHAPLGIAFFAPDGRLMRVNPAMCAMTGYSEDELVRAGMQGVIHPEDLPRSRSALARVASGETGVEQFEKRYLGKGGGLVWVSVCMAAVRGRDGAVEHCIAMIHDITAQKLAQAAREEVEARREAVLECSLDSIVTMDEQGRIVDFNAAAERTFGYPRGEAVGRKVEDLLVPERLRAAHRQGLLRHASVGEGPVLNRRMEMPAMRADGSEFPAELVVVPKRLPCGRLIYSSYIRDIHARKLAEEALRSTMERFQALAELAPVGIFITDAGGNNVYANPRWLEMTGLTAEQASGPGWARALHPEDKGRVIAEWYDVAERGADYGSECRFMHTGGRVLWIYAAARPLRDAQGKQAGYLGTITDVTWLKDTESRLREGLLEREELLRREASLRRELDHRVRNNLSALMGLVGLYQRREPSESGLAGAVRGKIMAMREVHDMIARGEGRPLELSRLAERMAAQLLTAEQARAVALEGPAVRIPEMQAGAIAIILQELFTNSRKHGAMGSGSGGIRLIWDLTDPSDPGALRMEWRESGGPPVCPPRAFGVGLTLIEGFAASELRGRVEFGFDEPGFSCTLYASVSSQPGPPARGEAQESVEGLQA